MIDVPARHLYLGEHLDPATREAARRVRLAENRALDRQEALSKLEAGVARDLAAIEEEWTAKPTVVEPLDVPPERSDIRVTARSLVWVPVA